MNDYVDQSTVTYLILKSRQQHQMFALALKSRRQQQLFADFVAFREDALRSVTHTRALIEKSRKTTDEAWSALRRLREHHE